MIDHVLGRPSVQFRKIQVLAVVSFWSFYLYRSVISIQGYRGTKLTHHQRRPQWPPHNPPHLLAPLQEVHGMADYPPHPPLPLHRTQLRQARRLGMPRTSGEPVLALLLPRHMGHNRAGCGLLVCHEDQEKGHAGFLLNGVQRVLSDMCRTGG